MYGHGDPVATASPVYVLVHWIWPGPNPHRLTNSDRTFRLTWPHQPRREHNEPLIRNAIRRNKFVHQPIVRRPPHSKRLVWIRVVSRIAAKPVAQLTRSPHSSVVNRLAL